MTDYKKYINALRKCAKEHENDRTSTGHIIVSDMCRDTANFLESLEQNIERKEVTELKEVYNKGYKDGQEALAFHLELCEEEAEPCEDCISRKDAEMCLTANITDMTIEEYISMVGDRLKGLPSIQPKPKTGHWEWVQYDSNPEIGNFHCSECNFMPASFNWASKHLNYCPNCGAKMESEDKE